MLRPITIEVWQSKQFAWCARVTSGLSSFERHPVVTCCARPDIAAAKLQAALSFKSDATWDIVQ